MSLKCNKHVGCFSSNVKLKSCVQLHWRTKISLVITVEVQNYGGAIIVLDNDKLQLNPGANIFLWSG